MKHNTYYQTILNIQNFNLIRNISEESKELLTSLYSSLDPLTYYMLEGRFVKSPKKIIKSSEKATSSQELNKLLITLKRLKAGKKKSLPIDLLDVIKAYKVLEQQMYHNGYSSASPFEGLRLGSYTDCLVKASDSITTLFLRIQNIPEDERKCILSLFHSSICIYRQFHVKAKPTAETITDKYNGTKTLAELEQTYFSEANIE